MLNASHNPNSPCIYFVPMASTASHYTTTADTADEIHPDYAGDEQAADYYPTPESIVHIGARATHVTVHVHAYAPPPPVSLTVA